MVLTVPILRRRFRVWAKTLKKNSSCNSVANVTLGGPRGSDYEANRLLGSDAVKSGRDLGLLMFHKILLLTSLWSFIESDRGMGGNKRGCHFTEYSFFHHHLRGLEL